MADDLQRVGLVFKADGAVDFKKTLRQVTDELSSNRNEFDRAKISWDESTSSMEKLQDRQKYLSKQTQLYSDKVSILQRELAEMEKSEKSSSQEISKKKQQIEKTKTTLAKYEKGLNDVNKEKFQRWIDKKMKEYNVPSYTNESGETVYDLDAWEENNSNN